MPDNDPRPTIGNPSEEASHAFLELSADVQEEIISLLRFLSLPEE